MDNHDGANCTVTGGTAATRKPKRSSFDWGNGGLQILEDGDRRNRRTQFSYRSATAAPWAQEAAHDGPMLRTGASMEPPSVLLPKQLRIQRHIIADTKELGDESFMA